MLNQTLQRSKKGRLLSTMLHRLRHLPLLLILAFLTFTGTFSCACSELQAAEPEAEAAPSGEASNAMEEEHVCHNSLTPFLYQRMCIKTPTSDIACSPQDSAGADGTRQQQQAGGAEPLQQELECLSLLSCIQILTEQKSLS